VYRRPRNNPDPQCIAAAKRLFRHAAFRTALLNRLKFAPTGHSWGTMSYVSSTWDVLGSAAVDHVTSQRSVSITPVRDGNNLKLAPLWFNEPFEREPTRYRGIYRSGGSRREGFIKLVSLIFVTC